MRRAPRKCTCASPARRSSIPDFYGIDTPEQKSLLAATHTLEEMREYIGVTSLAFLSVDGIYRVGGLAPAATMPARSSPTIASPAIIPPTSPTSSANPRKQQLSLLAEAG